VFTLNVADVAQLIVFGAVNVGSAIIVFTN